MACVERIYVSDNLNLYRKGRSASGPFGQTFGGRSSKKKNEGILWMSLPLEQWQVLTKFDGRCSWSIFWRMNEAISVQVLRLSFDIEHRKYREARNNTIGYRK